MSLSNITIDGRPLSEVVNDHLSREIHETIAEENRITRPPIPSRFSGNTSGERSSSGSIIWHSGQRETDIFVRGLVLPWIDKAPFVPSGMSVLGAVEYDRNTDKTKCHECGEWYSSLSCHIRGHKISATAYRKKHGITLKSKINGLKAQEKQAQIAKNRKGSKTFTVGHPRYGSGLGPPKGRPLSLEILNLEGKCQAQISAQLVALHAKLGRTPTANEIRAQGLRIATIESVFGAKMKQVLLRLNMKPRHKREWTVPYPKNRKSRSVAA